MTETPPHTLPPQRSGAWLTGPSARRLEYSLLQSDLERFIRPYFHGADSSYLWQTFRGQVTFRSRTLRHSSSRRIVILESSLID